MATTTTADVAGKRVKSADTPSSSWGKARERLAWLLVAPSLLVVFGVAIYPLFQAFRLSLTDTNINRPGEPSYVWFENYRYLFDNRGNPGYLDALWHTVQFSVASVALETILGIGVALIIHSNFKGRGVVRTAMLVPWAIPTVVSSRMWEWMLHDNYGVINDLLVNKLHILDSKVAFLSNASTSLPSIIAVDVWKTTPFMALLILAGLQVIPGDVYEASRVDGASKWQQFWQITLPLLRPALLVALIFRTLDAFRVFDIVYVMKGYAAESMTVAVWAQQDLVARGRLGRGSAASVVIFLCIGIMVYVYTRLVKVEEV
jgi:trehalose/maltose transport system permease protein